MQIPCRIAQFCATLPRALEAVVDGGAVGVLTPGRRPRHNHPQAGQYQQ